MGFYDRMKAGREAARVGATPTYKVLQSDLISGAEKERVASIASFVRTGDEAHKLAGHDGFAYKGLDIRGRCGVVTYRGKEVALLFKREIMEIEPGPADPVPERTLQEPAEAWIQINLLGVEDHVEHKSIADRLRSALASVQNLQLLWNDEKSARKRLEEKLAKREEERVELQVLRGKVESYAKTITEQILEAEALQSKLQQEKNLRKADQIKLVEELFPVFNTVWLAGIHRVQDQLYSMLQKQLGDALGKIGISLIEPSVGEEFNPALHHAVHATQLDAGSKEIGTVLQVSKVGWSLGTQVVSAAEVIVGIEKEVEEVSKEEGTAAIS